MNHIDELVDLPDPETQRLVHPLDLPAARRDYRIALLIDTLTSVPVGLCLAAVIWFAAGNAIAPLVAGAALIGFGALAARHYRGQAWAYIPRKRQDARRADPVAWEVAGQVVFAAVLALALLLVALRLTRPDVTDGVREYTIGMAGVVAVLMVVDYLVTGALRRGGARRASLVRLPGVIAVVACVAAGYVLAIGAGAPREWTVVLWGAATMALLAAGVGLWRLAARRRAAGGE